MSDRIKGCVVAFEKDLHEEDAEEIMQAIRQLRGVAAVSKKVSDDVHFMAKVHVREQLHKEFMALWERLSK